MSLVSAIEIRSFRGIAALKVARLGRVNVLVGKNNSCKSSLLEALSRGLSGPSAEDVMHRNVHECWARSRDEDRPFVRDLLQVGASECAVRVSGAAIDAKYRLSLERQALRWDVEAAAVREGKDIPLGLFFPSDAWNHKVETVLWRDLLQERGDRELAQAATDLFAETVDSLQMFPSGEIIVGLPRFGLRLDGQGSGFRAALRLLLVGRASKNGVLIVEEPECHQHAASLRRLAVALTKQAIDRNIQLFLSTHSLECVRAFAGAAAATPGEPGVEVPFSLFSLERQDDSGVSARWLSKETVLGLDESGTDVRFLDEYQ
jgi:hypothetical protein